MKVLLFLAVAIAAVLAASDFDYCTGGQCQTERKQSVFEREALHREIAKYKKIIADSTCSICNVQGTPPCHNGTCIVTGQYNYTCDCPDNTAGDDCGTFLSCEESNPCGVGAICTVFNHKKVCTCPPGTDGDPMVKCDWRSKTACMSGDPHYTTFDGTYFHYMGTCPMYVMKACDAKVDWSIIGTNALYSYNKQVSYISQIVFHTQGHEFKVTEALGLYIDGVQVYYPYYWPSQADAKIIATKPANQVQIQDVTQNAVITFSSGSLCVAVRLSPFFYGEGAMCGVFGNIDDVCTDDIKAANGTTLPITNCDVEYNAAAIEFEDTWITNTTVNNCVAGGVVNNNPNCSTDDAQAKCDLIRQAIDGLGPFGACEALNNTEQLYHDCTYDICHGTDQCEALDIFATICMMNLPFADIDSWRSPSFCPYTPGCPPNSHYSMKTPKCPDSCADPNYSHNPSCHDGYVEGCTCNPGYFFDSNGELDGYPFACRPLDQCGCLDDLGHYVPPHWSGINSNCTIESICVDGQLTSEPVACDPDATCINPDGHPTCQCDSGYQGSGFNCTDIDECLDSTVCSANLGQGECTNLPGTYQCTCFAPFTGANCQDYMPARHCADLYVFHGNTTDGVYNVSIGAEYGNGLTNDALNWTTVYCDMTSKNSISQNPGGWTLMAHGNNTGDKTFADYVAGFGDPATANVWLGLENVYLMTRDPTVLRIVVESCPQEFIPVDDCTYPYFYITDSASDYSIFLNSTCAGGLSPYRDSWISWDKTQLGPKFSNFDSGDSLCSKKFFDTGFWYNHLNDENCGNANLNGLRFICGDNDNAYNRQYLMWGNSPAKDAHMWLRPANYPDYDLSHPAPGTPTPLDDVTPTV